MKKILIIMLLLIALTRMLLTEDMQLMEITSGKFIEEYLPHYQIYRQIQLEGELLSYNVAKDGGEIIASTKLNENYIVQIFDREGNDLYIMKYDKPIGCKFSDSGEIFSIASKSNFEVFDRKGNLYASNKMMHPTLLPSPNGRYFYKKTGMIDGNQKKMIVYDRKLNMHTIVSPELDNSHSMTYRFVADNRLLVINNGWIKIFSFHDFGIELLNAIKLNPDKSLGELHGEFHYRLTDYTTKYFGIAVYDDGVYAFNMNGELIYRDKNPYDQIRFLDNENLIMSSFANHKICIINLKTNEKINYDFSFIWTNSEFYFQGYLENCYKMNEFVFCNIITGNSQYPQYCLILNTKNLSQNVKSLSNTYIDVLGSKLYILQLEKNPEFNLLEISNE